MHVKFAALLRIIFTLLDLSILNPVVCIGYLQIFLRVAEETGVDAEPESQVESSNGPQTTSAQRQAEEPETGTDRRSWMCASRHVRACAMFYAAFLHFHFQMCSPKMLPGRKRQSKRGSVASLFPYDVIKSLLDWSWTGLAVCLYMFLFLILALKVMFACSLQNLWRLILSVETVEVVSQQLAGGWLGSSWGLSSSSAGFMPAEAGGAS